jgi:hypothetical protein
LWTIGSIWTVISFIVFIGCAATWIVWIVDFAIAIIVTTVHTFWWGCTIFGLVVEAGALRIVGDIETVAARSFTGVAFFECASGAPWISEVNFAVAVVVDAVVAIVVVGAATASNDGDRASGQKNEHGNS